jgi:hypothetical protein
LGGEGQVCCDPPARSFVTTQSDQMFPTLEPAEITQLRRFGDIRSYGCGAATPSSLSKQEVAMRKLALLTAMMTLVASGTGTAIKAFAPARLATSPPPVTMSIEELHRQVDVRSLPELEIENLY